MFFVYLTACGCEPLRHAQLYSRALRTPAFASHASTSEFMQLFSALHGAAVECQLHLNL